VFAASRPGRSEAPRCHAKAEEFLYDPHARQKRRKKGIAYPGLDFRMRPPRQAVNATRKANDFRKALCTRARASQVSNAVGYAMHSSSSHDAVIRVYE